MENFNIIEELKKYLKTTSEEQKMKDWEEIKKYGNFGPTVDDFLYKNSITEPSIEEIEEASFEEFSKVMNREDEIDSAAQKCHAESNYKDLIQSGFREGSRWADEHPSKELIEMIAHQYELSCSKTELETIDDRLDWIIKTFWPDCELNHLDN